jgi:hypothetical protein
MPVLHLSKVRHVRGVELRSLQYSPNAEGNLFLVAVVRLAIDKGSAIDQSKG